MAEKASLDTQWTGKPPKPPPHHPQDDFLAYSPPKEVLLTNTLAASGDNDATIPSKDTNLARELAWSQSTRQSPSSKKTTTIASEDTVKVQLKQTSYTHIDDSKTRFNPGEYHVLTYTEKQGVKQKICVSQHILERLEDYYDDDAKGFDAFIRRYLIRKYDESKSMPFPFTVPETFYSLCRIVCKVTHELFADAINCSGILQDFCSADTCDELLGSVGKWENVEKKVAGAAGFPPFSEHFVQRIISSCEELVKGSKTFCRVYILPYHCDGILAKSERSYRFYGHIIAIMDPDTLNLRHQREFFKTNSEHLFRDWRPNIRTAMVIWVNETYLSINLIPSDVDECFTAWALETVGDSDILDYAALLGAFPDNCRNAGEKLQQFELAF